ncbi:hypothetical protein IGS68_00995 [Skermanella sp. TT6]|uniref:Uncharacterized protein n=1 Tax=Skermanella cutis TaxID=2775420 RepID=A0ABX7B6Z4_9PROT|nr:hypothetical protein [Skermanella sp. TT6]QQP89888.1 hypothetical protein IGS68_00995 [Skermanella sp. TT6]
MQHIVNLEAEPIDAPLASIGEDNRYVAFDFHMLNSGLVELRAVYNDYSPDTGRYGYEEIDRKVVDPEDAIDFAVDMERDAVGFLAEMNIGSHADGRFAEGVENALRRLMSASLTAAA